MAMKSWICRFGPHEIRVVNTWFSGAKLFIDGACVATDKRWSSVSARKPLIVHTFTDADGAQHVVQVFVVAWMSVQAAIFVDGLQYGGEELDISEAALRFSTPDVRALSADSGSAIAVPASAKR